MHRFINQINVSITTNRTCTLRCDHCYIAPHLFDDKSQMTTETFRKIFDQVEQLVIRDKRLNEVEWEAIGGETTMMPFEWWEENLPWALERIDQINKMINSPMRNPGSLNFLTNLVYADKRYTDLINEYGHHPCFSLYTSWEPDTRRFGKNNKLFPKFLETLEQINTEEKILDIILTKTVVEMGPQYLIDTFVSRGVTDFSIKMLSPYGSGKEFFKHNMIDFKAMSDYLRELGRIKPDHVTYTPEEEMLSSLYRGTSFQCNGNFKYDLAIEPEGTCTFNANQTADEASLGSKTIHIDDPLWSEKVMYENTKEENNKLSLEHPACNQCEYMRYCNGGWYHYKVHDQNVIRQFDKEDCAGYRFLWDERKSQLAGGLFDLTGSEHKKARARVRSGAQWPQEGVRFEGATIKESELPKSYQDYFEAMSEHPKDVAVVLDVKRKYHKTLMERIWFYESLGVPIIIKDPELLTETIVDHWLYRNITSTFIDVELISQWLADNTRARISDHVMWATVALRDVHLPSSVDFVADERNEELFRTLIQCGIQVPGRALTIDGMEPTGPDHYVQKLKTRVDLEEKMRKTNPKMIAVA